MSDDTMKCAICGEPMPAGEQMFKFHGYSGPCPKPALPAAEPADAGRGQYQSHLDAIRSLVSPLQWDAICEVFREQDALTRPPSEAAAWTPPLLCGCTNETQQRLCVMRDKCCKPYALASQQAVKP